MRPLLRTCLGLLLLAPLSAVTVDELVAAVVEDIPEDVLLEPGNTTLPEELAALSAADFGLDETQALELQLRVAEAWIDSGVPDQAERVAREVLDQVAPGHPLRDRAGLAVVAAWGLRLERAEDPSALPDAHLALKDLGEFSPEVRARARVVEADRRIAENTPEAALPHLDAALELLTEGSARARVPVYALRVLAMEAAGTEAKAIQGWLQERAGDPAVDLVLSTRMTDSQKLVGQPAPALELPRLDGQGTWKLADHAGKPVLIYFFATWCKPCVNATPAVVELALAREDAIEVVGVSLDTKDTTGRLPDYIARYGITFPLLGERLGWDGEADDQLHVEAIPHCVLIGPDGRIAAVGLVGETPAATMGQLSEAVDQALGEGGDGGADAMEDIP